MKEKVSAVCRVFSSLETNFETPLTQAQAASGRLRLGAGNLEEIDHDSRNNVRTT